MYSLLLYACSLGEPRVVIEIPPKVGSREKKAVTVEVQAEENPDGSLVFPTKLNSDEYLTIIPQSYGGTHMRLLHKRKEVDYTFTRKRQGYEERMYTLELYDGKRKCASTTFEVRLLR